MFGYLDWSKDDLNIATSMKEHELLDFLNLKINTFLPDKISDGALFTNYKDNAIITFIDSISRTVGTRAIMRNIPGAFSWEFSQLNALNEKCSLNGSKSIDSFKISDFRYKTVDPYEEKPITTPRSFSSSEIFGPEFPSI
jgi:hypothetical protein